MARSRKKAMTKMGKHIILQEIKFKGIDAIVFYCRIDPKSSLADAETHLSEKEREYYDKRTLWSRERKAGWLASRLAAKTAIVEALRRNMLGTKSETIEKGNKIISSSIDISSGTSKKPKFQINGSKQGEYKLSMSHSANIGIATVSISDVGVDIEKKRRVSESLIQKVFSRIELSDLPKTTANSRTPWIHHLKYWCAKEAVAKATGAGLGQEFIKIRLKYKAANLMHALIDGKPANGREQRFLVHTKTIKDAVAALAIKA